MRNRICSFTFSVASSHLRLHGNMSLYRVEGLKMRCCLLFSSHKFIKSRGAFYWTDDANVSNLIGYPRRTIRPKIDPWHMCAQFKKQRKPCEWLQDNTNRTHRIAKLQNASTSTGNGSHCHVCLLLVNLYLPAV